MKEILAFIFFAIVASIAIMAVVWIVYEAILISIKIHRKSHPKLNPKELSVGNKILFIQNDVVETGRIMMCSRVENSFEVKTLGNLKVKKVYYSEIVGSF
jgi:hypothetical protein